MKRNLRLAQQDHDKKTGNEDKFFHQQISLEHRILILKHESPCLKSFFMFILKGKRIVYEH
jgi:hypothetical protein